MSSSRSSSVASFPATVSASDSGSSTKRGPNHPRVDAVLARLGRVCRVCTCKKGADCQFTTGKCPFAARQESAADAGRKAVAWRVAYANRPPCTCGKGASCKFPAGECPFVELNAAAARQKASRGILAEALTKAMQQQQSQQPSVAVAANDGGAGVLNWFQQIDQDLGPR